MRRGLCLRYFCNENPELCLVNSIYLALGDGDRKNYTSYLGPRSLTPIQQQLFWCKRCVLDIDLSCNFFFLYFMFSCPSLHFSLSNNFIFARCSCFICHHFISFLQLNPPNGVPYSNRIHRLFILTQLLWNQASENLSKFVYFLMQQHKHSDVIIMIAVVTSSIYLINWWEKKYKKNHSVPRSRQKKTGAKK